MTWALAHAATATPESASSPITVTYAGVVAKLYLLALSRATAADPFTTVTDSGGNTWTQIDYTPKSGSTGRRVELWWCIPTSTFATVDAAYTGAGQAQATLLEITGHDPADLIDAYNSNFAAASTTPAVVNITPTVADTLVIAVVQANSNNHSTAVSVPSGWTDLAGYNVAGPKILYRSNPSAGVAVGAAVVLTASVGSGVVIAGFTMAAGGGGGGGFANTTVWNGSAELPVGTVTKWNGATEDPVASLVP